MRIARLDPAMEAVKNDPIYNNHQWFFRDLEGNECSDRGLYFMCDGVLVLPYQEDAYLTSTWCVFEAVVCLMSGEEAVRVCVGG